MDNPVLDIIESYPPEASSYLKQIRSLIFLVAEEQNLGEITETLKWGEPSYICKHGSTLRIDFKSKNPQTISLFFNCKTIIVETIREIFGDSFAYNGNRELILQLNEPLPEEKLKICISFALQYHKLKKLPLLGY